MRRISPLETPNGAPIWSAVRQSETTSKVEARDTELCQLIIKNAKRLRVYIGGGLLSDTPSDTPNSPNSRN